MPISSLAGLKPYPDGPPLSNVLSPSAFCPHGPNRTWLDFVGNYRCGADICPCCLHTIVGDRFSSSVSGRSYTVGKYINCNTKYVIYLITCKDCHIQYVGRTTRRLRD